MISSNPQIINIMNENWYIETQTGLDGPFESEKSATQFLEKMKQADSAQQDFAGLQFSPKE